MGGGAVSGRFGIGLLVGTALLASAWTAVFAQALVPIDTGQRLQAAVARSDAYRQQTTQAVAGLRNPALARIYGENAQRNADAAISAAVVSEIARQPRLAPAIVARAIEFAPASRDAIINAAQSAFPGYVARGQAHVSFLCVPPTVRRAPSFASVAPPLQRFGGAPQPRFSGVPTHLAANQTQPAPIADAMSVTGGPEQINDPLESVNRAIFAFNDVVDTFTLRPVAALYGYVTPEVARVAVRRAARNLNSPVVLVNDLLQLDPVGAGVTTGRFLNNSTAGILGLFDVAKLIGLEEHHSDFGADSVRLRPGSGSLLSCFRSWDPARRATRPGGSSTCSLIRLPTFSKGMPQSASPLGGASSGAKKFSTRWRNCVRYRSIIMRHCDLRIIKTARFNLASAGPAHRRPTTFSTPPNSQSTCVRRSHYPISRDISKA